MTDAGPPSIFAVIVTLSLLGAAILVSKRANEEDLGRKACEERGGVFLAGRDSGVCVKREALAIGPEGNQGALDMATQKYTMYVHAYFDEGGRFNHFCLLDHLVANPDTSGFGFLVPILEPITFEYSVPDSMRDVNLAGAEAIEETIKKVQAESQMQVMKLRAAQNVMRGLEYSEVVDAER